MRLLEALRQSPGLYFRHTEPGSVQDFLRGVSLTLGTVIGAIPSQPQRIAVCTGRGWRWDASVGLVHEMISRGLAVEAMIDELIAIEIEVWKRVVAEHAG